MSICLFAQRKQVNIDDNWKFAFGHAANPEKDFNYSIKTSFQNRVVLQELQLMHGLMTAVGDHSTYRMIGQ